MQLTPGSEVVAAPRRAAAWAGSPGAFVLAASAVAHAVVHLLLLAFLPLAAYSELSAHDGMTYYVVGFDPFPAAPAFAIMRYKRLAFALLGRWIWPWEAHVGFALLGIAGAALANLFFYRISARFSKRPGLLTLVFACSPYLFAAAHVALPDPLSVGLALGALHFAFARRFWPMVLCGALAVAFKEVAAVAVLGVAAVVLLRDGWRPAVAFLALAGLPALAVVALYAGVWGDPLWYFGESRTTLVPAPLTLLGLLLAPGQPFMVRWGAVVNLALLGGLAWAIWRLRANLPLLLYLIICTVPLLFLDERQYQSDFDMARQYMAAAPALLAYERPLARMPRWVLALLLAVMLAYALYYILSVSRFFLIYKELLLQLLPLGR